MIDYRWLPIASAPQGRVVLVWGGAKTRFGYLDQHGNWRSSFHGPIKVAPTHWMPLPEPPKEEELETMK